MTAFVSRFSAFVHAIPAEHAAPPPLVALVTRPGYTPAVPLQEEVLRNYGVVTNFDQHRRFVETLVPSLPPEVQPDDALAGLLYTVEDLRIPQQLNTALAPKEGPEAPNGLADPTWLDRHAALLCHLLRLFDAVEPQPTQLWRGVHLPPMELHTYAKHPHVCWPQCVSLTSDREAATAAALGRPAAPGLTPLLFDVHCTTALQLALVSPYALKTERVCYPFTVFRVLGLEEVTDASGQPLYTRVRLAEAEGPLSQRRRWP
eukprot:EG_transcript_23315